jgi:predicted glycosyl hydrolase (DUF1957 family)
MSGLIFIITVFLIATFVASMVILNRFDEIIKLLESKPKGIHITEMEFREFMVAWLEKYNVPIAWVDDKKIGELFETIRKAKESR